MADTPLSNVVNTDAINLTAAPGTAVTLNGGTGGGQMNINGGAATGAGGGGSVSVLAGWADTNGEGGGVTIFGGNGVGSAQNGGTVDIRGGQGDVGSGRGGNVNIEPGGGDNNGYVIINNLPGADPLVLNALYIDAGVLKISAGP